MLRHIFSWALQWIDCHWFTPWIQPAPGLAFFFFCVLSVQPCTSFSLCSAGYGWWLVLIYCEQGFIYRPDRPNRRGPVPVYRSGLAGNRSVPVEFKFKFKKLSSTGLYRYTGRIDRFTGRFDRFEFKSKFKITCVIGLERYTGRFHRFTGRFDRFTKWALMGRLIFFFFVLTLNAWKVC